jgi:phage virion morphogenesis protein
MSESIEIKLNNEKVEEALLEVAKKATELRPLMRNIAGIMADSTEENFKEQGRPKWQDLAEATKTARRKTGHYPGQILQVSGQLAISVTTQYDDTSATIGSNKVYSAIQQLGGQAGRKKNTTIPARPYLKLTDDDSMEIIVRAKNFFQHY